MPKAVVLGPGGREHSIAWKLQQELGEVIFAPGNPGVDDRHRRDVKLYDFEGIYQLLKAERPDIAIVGPEQPLVDGLIDYVHSRDSAIPIFGPTANAARLEGSKTFAKQLMIRYGIPTAEFRIADSLEDARKYADFFLKRDYAVVLKADGLAGGKGSFVCRNEHEETNALVDLGKLGKAADKIVVEKFLPGEEVSYIVLTDGYDALPLLPTQDHKTAYDDDNGPNTGGMGAYTRPKVVTKNIEDKMRRIMVRTIRAMHKEGRPYKGFLYGGFMIYNDEANVVEFNCRLGDPETQPVMVSLDSHLSIPVYAATEGDITKQRLAWKPREAMTVVLAAKGYPNESYKQHIGKVIHGLERSYPNVVLFHAGTARENGAVVNSGGRVLGVTGFGPTLREARDYVYAAISPDAVYFEGIHYRKDIGWRSLLGAFSE